MRGVAIRAVVAVLALVALAAFLIDWNGLVGPGAVRDTLDASLDGDPTQLRARVPGYLAQVPARDYAPVHAGDLLYGIDDRDYRARVEAARAEFSRSEAAVAEAHAQVLQQEAQVGVAEAELARAAAERELRGQERARQAALLNTESYLARDWQAAVAADRQQAATVDGNRRAVLADQIQLEVLRARLAGQRAALDSRRAALAAAEVELGYTRIVAPFDGVTTARLARAGEYVAPGAALITLVPLHGVWAVANFREVQLTRMHPGQPARVRVDAIPGVVFAGHVDSIAPDSQAQGSAMPPDRAAGNFTKIEQRIPVKVVLDARPDFDARLLPGLSAEVCVDVSGGAGARP